MNRTVGTCGACGGRVSVPASWLSTVPPVPACEACGRQAARPWGPVVEMAPKRWTTEQAFLRRSQGQSGGEPGGGEGT